MSPLPDPGPVVETFRAELPALLGPRLLGLYLTGSLVGDDFDPEISDVDLIAATDGLVRDRFDALARLHETIAGANPAWRGRIEIAYVPLATLRSHRAERSEILITSPGEPFHAREVGPEWTLGWSVVAASGVALLGPPPAELFPVLTREETRAALRAEMRDWSEWARGIESPGYASYAVLTAARALFTWTDGAQASKPAAATWLAREWPEWAELLASALRVRGEMARGLPAHFDLPRMVRFVDAVVAAVNESEGGDAPIRVSPGT